jgi:hypothetical protein
MFNETESGGPEHGRESLAENEEREDESFWSAYWERFPAPGGRRPGRGTA